MFLLTYIGKRVDIVYDADSLQIYHGLKLVTSHMRNDTPYGYTQKEAHRLPGRHGSYEKDLGEIYERAGAIDNILLNYLREVAAQKKYLPLAFRTCRGIMSLEKGGTTRLTSVSGRAPVRPCPPRGGMRLCLRGAAVRLQRGAGDSQAW